MQSKSNLLHSFLLSTDGKFKYNFDYLSSLDRISILSSQDEIHLFEKQDIQYAMTCIKVTKEEENSKKIPPKLHSTEEILEAYNKKLLHSEKKAKPVYNIWICSDLLLTLNSDNRIQIYVLRGK